MKLWHVLTMGVLVALGMVAFYGAVIYGIALLVKHVWNG